MPEDSEGVVPLSTGAGAADAGSARHGRRGAPGNRVDSRPRNVAWPPAAGRRVPARRHACAPPRPGTAARCGGARRGRSLSAALTALHDAGYVHGDVKPSNIGFASDGTAKLLDFGLARLTNAHDQPAGGTLSYMSPEVLCGERAGEADDVWSLRVVLYEMVARRRPFIGDGAGEVAKVAACIRRQRIRPAAAEAEGTDGFPEFCEVDRVRRFGPDGWTVGATCDGTCVRRCAARTLNPLHSGLFGWPVSGVYASRGRCRTARTTGCSAGPRWAGDGVAGANPGVGRNGQELGVAK